MNPSIDLKIIEAKIRDIKKSPLYFLFISSRELFHSNFWAWLFELNNVELLKLFIDETKLVNTKDVKLFREKRLLKKGEKSFIVDLYFESDRKPFLLIENKIKDFPKREQLTGIENAINTKIPTLTIATLFWDTDLSFENWNVVKYKDISNRIIPELFSSNIYYQQLISDYKQFVGNLAELADHLKAIKEFDFTQSLSLSLYKLLNEIKLWEGYQKLRASHLLYFYDQIKQGNTLTRYGINNQRITIDFSIKIDNEHDIGIQIEDNQYRKFVNGPKSEGLSQKLLKANFFFDSNWKSTRKKTMMQYKPHFKYQFEKLEKMNYEELFKKINTDLDWINSNKSKVIEFML